MIVLDASVLANVVGDGGPEGHHARRFVAAAGDGAVPDLADVETVAVTPSTLRWPKPSPATS